LLDDHQNHNTNGEPKPRECAEGVQSRGPITARLWLPSRRYEADTAQNAFFDRLTERLAGDFGPRAVTLASDLPIEGGTYGSVGLTSPRFPDGAGHVEKRIVSSNYFDVLKARLVRGRFFQPSDVGGSQPVVVVNETFARLWLEGDPIGQNVAFSWGINGTQTVVGVVACQQFCRYAESDGVGVGRR
jgi:hypothetical protein